METYANTVNILIVDDHEVISEGIRRIFANRTHFAISTAPDPATATASVALLKPQVCILELDLGGTGNGFRILHHIKVVSPQTKVIVFTRNSSEVYARRTLNAGAFAFVSKGAAISVLCDAVAAAISNEPFAQDYHGEPMQFTAREQQVLDLLGQGYSILEVAAELRIAYKTVANAGSRLNEKLGFHRTTDLIRYAMELHRSKTSQ